MDQATALSPGGCNSARSECLADNEVVGGSSPPSPTTPKVLGSIIKRLPPRGDGLKDTCPCSSMDRAPDYGSGGCAFESRRGCQTSGGEEHEQTTLRMPTLPIQHQRRRRQPLSSLRIQSYGHGERLPSTKAHQQGAMEEDRACGPGDRNTTPSPQLLLQQDNSRGQARSMDMGQLQVPVLP